MRENGRKLKAGLIGCGRIGTQKHIQAFVENRSDIELVAVCDLVEEKAKKAAEIAEEKTGQLPRVFTDHMQLLQLPLDFVTIATESGYHHAVTMDALGAGKHVLVEKPMALSVAHMDQMIQSAKERNLRLGVCFQNRFNPPIQEVRKKIESGAFGRIFHVTARILWNRNEEYYRQASWRGTRQLDGGTLMNQCSHNIDLLQWMVGAPVSSLHAVTRNFNHPYIECEDFGSALLQFENGTVGIIEGTANVYPKNLEETLSIFGEKGTVVIGGLAVNRIQTWRFDGEEQHPFMELPDPKTVYGNGHVPLFQDFVGAIRGGREPFVSG
ncbi:MAG TPA: Gfo/Idh/MocA family oxidoreductase, partial [Thermotogota bacterium]|nr:Gfo/Idh/MocA family oxidoreductase [Thermotogota bacterium]